MSEVEPKEVPLTLLEVIAWAQHPSDTCADQPIIPAYNFAELATDISTYDEVVLTVEEIEEVFRVQSMRFSACGANNSDPERYAVLRKNPKTGWNYLRDLII
jgi:hypothetical protein